MPPKPCTPPCRRTSVPCAPFTSPTWRSPTRPTPTSGGAGSGPRSAALAAQRRGLSREGSCERSGTLRAFSPTCPLPPPCSAPSPAASTTRTPPSTPCPASCRPPRSWARVRRLAPPRAAAAQEARPIACAPRSRLPLWMSAGCRGQATRPAWPRLVCYACASVAACPPSHIAPRSPARPPPRFGRAASSRTRC